MLNRRTAALFLQTILVAILLAACGRDTGDTLLIYSGRSESLVGPLIESYAAMADIELQVKYAATGPLVATLQEEGAASPADLFFSQDPGGLGALTSMLVPLPAELLDSVPDWARSDEGRWVGVSGRRRVVVYNNQRLSGSELPSSIWDFGDPKWRGRIGWAPTNASFQAMITGMRSIWGAERTVGWLERMVANEPVVYPKNSPIVAAVAAGEIDVGFVNHYYLHRFIAEEGESFPASNHYMSGGDPGGLVLVAGVGLLATTDNREQALDFIEFLLSDEAQRYFVAETFEFPVRQDGLTSEQLLVSGFPPTDLPITSVPPAQLTDLEGARALLRTARIVP